MKKRYVGNVKKRKKKSSFKVITGIVVLIIFVILGIYNLRNYKLYKYIISYQNETVDIYYNFKYMLIWNKTIDYVKENKKEIRFIGKDYTITVPSYDFSKYYNFDVDVYFEQNKTDDFYNLNTCIIDLSNFDDLYAMRNISVKLPSEMLENSIVDVYKYESDEAILYKKSVNVVNENISFNIKEDEICKKYMIVNVPLEDIIVENDTLEINNNTSLSLALKTYPENATVGGIIFESNSTSLNITSDGVINAKEAGEYKINISDEEKKINKEVTLKVNPVAVDINVDKYEITLQVEKTSKINAIVVPEDAINKELIFESTNSNVATVDEVGKVTGISVGKCDIRIRTKYEPVVENIVGVNVIEKTEEPKVSNGITYINGVLIANKKYSLPADYNPGVDPTALQAYYEMRNAAMQNGFDLKIVSGFRSYETQKGLYNRYVSTYGKAAADRFSAEPGKSEHQTGLAFDLGWVDDAYGKTAEGKWLAANCYKYGFIIRYPEGKEAQTGYMYEPWHVRYLGNPLATDVYNSGLCLEEYLGI